MTSSEIKAWKTLIDLIPTNKLDDPQFDGLIIISEKLEALKENKTFIDIYKSIEKHANLHKNFENGLANFLVHDGLPGNRIIYSSTGPINKDCDDVRVFKKAGVAAGKLALSIGCKSPLVIVLSSKQFENAKLLSILGLLHLFYVPINIRESSNFKKVNSLGIFNFENDFTSTENFLKIINAFQASFTVCRDIGDGDPIRMAPIRVVEYIENLFKHSSIHVEITSDPDVIKKEYPLVAAVNRSANSVKEHQARLIWLTYNNEKNEKKTDKFETLFLVGKGVTLDTGGTDVKTSGSMFGMSRDKYGSAVVAGFFKALDILQPKGLKVIGCMCMVRNSIGSNSYTCDEIITARSGKRVHIYNTDAEGRIAMVEPLNKFKDDALKEKNPHLMTVATLTGHCVLTYGSYPAIIDNGPARISKYAEELQKTSDLFGQPVEISRLHKEDYEFHLAETDAADLRQANTKPSVQTPRGHITPAAFLISGSGLDKHGLNSEKPLKYTHIDIGSSMGTYPETTFPNPLLTLISHHVILRLNEK